MKYLVSIEACPYFLWQIEILIESFKMHGIADDLIIAVAAKDDEFGVAKNFNSHPHKFYHINRRTEEGPYFNKPYAAVAAIQEGFVKDKFVLIDPDMILIQPMEQYPENIVFSTDPFCKLELMEQNGLPVRDWIKDSEWPLLGAVYQFNEVDGSFFKSVLNWGEKLKSRGTNRYTAKIAWILTLKDFSAKYKITAQPMECTMLNFTPKGSFIHYSHGIPPYFYKQMFPLGFKGSLSKYNPYEAITEYNPNLTTDYVHKVIQSMNR